MFDLTLLRQQDEAYCEAHCTLVETNGRFYSYTGGVASRIPITEVYKSDGRCNEISRGLAEIRRSCQKVLTKSTINYYLPAYCLSPSCMLSLCLLFVSRLTFRATHLGLGPPAPALASCAHHVRPHPHTTYIQYHVCTSHAIRTLHCRLA